MFEANEVVLMIGAADHRAMSTTHTTTNEGHAIAAGEGERIWIVGDTMTL